MAYYKVLINENGTLWSATGCCPTIYRVGQWTRRPRGCGPLSVFSNFKTALQFAYDFQADCIYTCKAVQSKDRRQWNKEGRQYGDGTPDNVVLADKIYLLEQVW